MSLLNDALKRASQSDRNRQRTAQPQAFLHPSGERRGHSKKRGLSLAMALGAGSVLALGLAGWFFWQLWGASHSFAPAHVESAPAVVPVIRVEIPTTTTASTAEQVATSIPAPTPATADPAPAVPAEPAWPADLKVTGIFFRATNPLALINGKTVGVGEDIDGIRVTQIEKDRVTVEWNGKMKELKVNDGGI